MPMVSENYVYLDWAATAPLCEEAALAMEPYLRPGVANLALGMNANSLHSPGRAAFSALERARREFAQAVGARSNEITFTSGATEADNAAVLGLAHAAVAARKHAGKACGAPHVITTAIEHDAVLAPVKRLEAQGFRVTRLAPDARGFVSVDALERALDTDTVLASVQLANSEVGSIQPVAACTKLAHGAGALFHTDATQALGKMPVDVAALGVDAASFSAHKVGGPKGVGALYMRSRTPFEAGMLGGGQESGRRSGTQNVCGIAGFVAAAKASCAAQAEESVRQRALRDALYAGLSEFSQVRATVSVEPGSGDYLPNIVSVLVRGMESETLILRFDQLGFGVSGGSACSSQSLDPSHVLSAMGVPRDDALGALRVSIGRYTTEQDVDAFLAAFPQVFRWQ